MTEKTAQTYLRKAIKDVILSEPRLDKKKDFIFMMLLVPINMSRRRGVKASFVVSKIEIQAGRFRLCVERMGASLRRKIEDFFSDTKNRALVKRVTPTHFWLQVQAFDEQTADSSLSIPRKASRDYDTLWAFAMGLA